ATILARDGGKDVVLWVRDVAQAKEIAARRENRKYLAGIRVPDRVEVTADLERAIASDDLIVAAPSRGVRELRDRVSPLLRKGHRVLSATKGLAEDGRRMSQLWAEVLAPDRVAVLSGPNISREIAAGLAGFGDLIATCTSTFSRNRMVGEMLAKGVPVGEIAERLGGQVAEGMSTAGATYRAAGKRGVVMPITEQTHLVLSEGKPIREAMRDLMDREQGEEVAAPLAEFSHLLATFAAAQREESASGPRRT